MAVELYTLSEMRNRIKTEFGIAEGDATQEDLIDEKINEAISEVVRRRPNWPWQRKTLNIDISAKTTHTGDFTNGSVSVTGVSNVSSIAAREVVKIGTSGDSADDYIVKAVSGDTLTLDRQYTGSTAADVSFVVEQGYLELPEDFLRMDIAYPVRDLAHRHCFDFQPATKWYGVRRHSGIGLLDHYYTVISDPLNLNRRLYMGVYPTLGDQMTVQGSYFMVPPKLEEDDDEPILPLNDRPVALCKAFHLYARTRNDPRQTAYFAEYDLHIKSMLSRYELSDEEPSTRSRSSLAELEVTGYAPFTSDPDFTSS